MIAYSIIQKSQLEGAHRMDAEYYQPEYLELDRMINRFTNYPLSDLIISFGSGKNLLQANCSEKQMSYFIRTQNVRAVFINKEGITCIDSHNNKYPKLNEGDILAVRVGEGVGNTSIVTPEFAGHSFSDNVIRLKIKKLNPYFVIIFLNSKAGLTFLKRVSKGSARSLISSENIYNIRVPDLGEEIGVFCKKVVTDSVEKTQKSEFLYCQAENLLLEELGLKDFKIAEDLSYIVNLSALKFAHRADAEYFQPKYEKYVEKIKRQHIKLLGDLVSVKKGIEPGSEMYQNEGNFFIRVSNLTKQGLIDKDQKYLSVELYQKLKKNFEPKAGEILLTKDATPGIAYVLKESVKGIIASGIIRLKLKENIEPEYLAFFINSIIGQMQIERAAGGSIIAHWKPEQIKRLQVPILPKSIQRKIALLVRQSYETRKKAKELLEQAKRKVEGLIGTQ